MLLQVVLHLGPFEHHLLLRVKEEVLEEERYQHPSSFQAVDARRKEEASSQLDHVQEFQVVVAVELVALDPLIVVASSLQVQMEGHPVVEIHRRAGVDSSS